MRAMWRFMALTAVVAQFSACLAPALVVLCVHEDRSVTFETPGACCPAAEQPRGRAGPAEDRGDVLHSVALAACENCHDYALPSAVGVVSAQHVHTWPLIDRCATVSPDGFVAGSAVAVPDPCRPVCICGPPGGPRLVFLQLSSVLRC